MEERNGRASLVGAGILHRHGSACACSSMAPIQNTEEIERR